jgi:hypothetical protein
VLVMSLQCEVEQWLESQHVSLWGGAGWDLQDEKELPLAAEWFATQINSFFEFVGGISSRA